MKVAGIKAEHLAVGDSVAEIKFVRPDDVTFRADAEQLGLHRVEDVVGIQRFGENGVERFGQALPRAVPVNRCVLVAVRHPDVGDARRAKCAPHRRADVAADNAVLDPKLADALVAMGEREPVVRVGVGEKSGVKIKAQLLLFCPVDPALEVVWFQCIALDCFSAGLGVGRMQIEAVIARDE